MTETKFTYNLPNNSVQGLEVVDENIEHFIHFDESDVYIPDPIRAIFEDVAHLGFHVGEEGVMNHRDFEGGLGKVVYHPNREQIHYGTGGFETHVSYPDIGRAVMASAETRDDILLEFRNDRASSGINIVGLE